MSFHSMSTSTSTTSVMWRSRAALTLSQAAMASGGKSPIKFGLNIAAVVFCVATGVGAGAFQALALVALPINRSAAIAASTVNLKRLNILDSSHEVTTEL